MSGRAEDFIDYPSERLKRLHENMEHCEWDFQEMVSCYSKAKNKVVKQLIAWGNLVKAVKACKDANSNLQDCTDEDWDMLVESDGTGALPEELDTASRRYRGFLDAIDKYLKATESTGMAPPLARRLKELELAMERVWIAEVKVNEQEELLIADD